MISCVESAPVILLHLFPAEQLPKREWELGAPPKVFHCVTQLKEWRRKCKETEPNALGMLVTAAAAETLNVGKERAILGRGGVGETLTFPFFPYHLSADAFTGHFTVLVSSVLSNYGSTYEKYRRTNFDLGFTMFFLSSYFGGRV